MKYTIVRYIFGVWNALTCCNQIVIDRRTIVHAYHCMLIFYPDVGITAFASRASVCAHASSIPVAVLDNILRRDNSAVVTEDKFVLEDFQG